MTISVVDVAEYVLVQQGEMTTMKLHKLLYYCQAWHLVWDGVPLFNEEIQAWANGPIVPALYELHRGEFTVQPGYFYDKLQGRQTAGSEAETPTTDPHTETPERSAPHASAPHSRHPHS